MRTERLTILITPEEKADISAKADRLGLTASDMVRLAIDGFNVDAVEQVLLAAAQQIERSVEEMNEVLDETHAFVQGQLAEMRAERAAAQGEQLEAA